MNYRRIVAVSVVEKMIVGTKKSSNSLINATIYIFEKYENILIVFGFGYLSYKEVATAFGYPLILCGSQTHFTLVGVIAGQI